MKAINAIVFPLILLCTFSAQQSYAQCPVSTTKGVHIVQKGENLYRIAKAYGITLEQIGLWNGIAATDVLPSCKSLYVAAPTAVNSSSAAASTGPAAPTAPVMHSTEVPPMPSTTKGAGDKPLSAYAARTDGTHILQPGETIAGVARLYGYSEERFRFLNQLSKDVVLMPGSALRSTDCDCNGRIWLANTSMAANTPEVKTTTTPVVYTAGEEYYPSAVDNNTVGTTTTTTYQGNTGYTGAETHVTGSAGEEMRYSSTTTTKENPNQPKPMTTQPQPAPTSGAVAAATYMSVEERQMMDEINLLRGNPTGYIKYVEEYIDYMRKNGEMGSSISTAYELINELKNTQSLSQLAPMPCIYSAIKKHGIDQRPTGDVNHQGTDGSWPWDRVVRECPSMQDGNENIVGGPSDIRRAVILLLVDDGIDSRGHRRTLLDARWKYAACHKVGQVGSMPNTWIQNFGF